MSPIHSVTQQTEKEKSVGSPTDSSGPPGSSYYGPLLNQESKNNHIYKKQ